MPHEKVTLADGKSIWLKFIKATGPVLERDLMVDINAAVRLADGHYQLLVKKQTIEAQQKAEREAEQTRLRQENEARELHMASLVKTEIVPPSSALPLQRETLLQRLKREHPELGKAQSKHSPELEQGRSLTDNSRAGPNRNIEYER